MATHFGLIVGELFSLSEVLIRKRANDFQRRPKFVPQFLAVGSHLGTLALKTVEF